MAAGIDPDLFVRQIDQESGFNPNAHNNSSGADGIAQIIPRFHPGVNTKDPYASLSYAANLIAANVHLYGSYRRALIAYNWGPGNLLGYTKTDGTQVPAWNGRRETLPVETQNYLDIILGPGWPEPGASPPVTLKLSEVLARARAREAAHDPYVWGGKFPPSTDCSGFVAFCYDGKVRSFTDFIFTDTERVDGRDVAPGDIVLFQYQDPDQQGVRFPHVELYLDDATVLGNRYPMGVGVHPQLARSFATRFYRRLPGVIVDTMATPVPIPVPPPVPHDDEAALRTKLSYATHEVVTALQKEVDAIEGSIGALRAAIDSLRQTAPV